MSDTILVTGGAGFIGSNFVLQSIQPYGTPVVNLDKLTYAGNLRNLEAVQSSPLYQFVRGDICDRELLRKLFCGHRPRAVVHFAAETHVDRSIVAPDDFLRTNVHGTFCLLDEALQYWRELELPERENFRFLHVSTDEVYGSLGPADPPFTENTRYSPNSPYSASKAASDHLARSYHRTHGLPVIITNCSNNYGPFQFPEKLIPLMILNALAGKPLPVYGDGMNIRDWLYVEDHCDALRAVLERGRSGENYNIGGDCQRTNLETVRSICEILQELRPAKSGNYQSLITFVPDRPGHDRRYAVGISKIQGELGWKPREIFESGLRRTVLWYLEHESWVHDVTSGAYQKWISQNYAARGAACEA